MLALVLAIAPAGAGCARWGSAPGGSDAGAFDGRGRTPEPDADRDAGVPDGAGVDAAGEGVPACATVDVDSPALPMPLSNTLRLGGTVSSGCGRPLAVAVTLDGEPLPPVTAPTVPEADRYGVSLGDAGSGRWHLTTNLWCRLQAGLDPRAGHRLRVVVTAAQGDGTPLGERTVDVTFSGVDGATDIVPWVPGAWAPRGSEPGNPSSEVDVRDHVVPVELDGAPRDYHYQATLPAGYDPARATPVVFLFHGWSGNPLDYQGFPDSAGVRQLWPAHGYIIISPNGHWYDPSKNIGAFGCIARQCEIREGHNWYTPVLKAIARDVMARYTVDPRRVHAAGFSCGASYAYCLGLTLSGKFASAVIMDANQVPIRAVSYGPYGYFPADWRRETPLKFVTGATRADWEKGYGEGGTIRDAWCMSPEYDWAGANDHTWYTQYDDAIAGFMDRQAVR